MWYIQITGRFYNVAIAIPEGYTFRMASGYRAVNRQVSPCRGHNAWRRRQVRWSVLPVLVHLTFCRLLAVDAGCCRVRGVYHGDAGGDLYPTCRAAGSAERDVASSNKHGARGGRRRDKQREMGLC